MLEGTPNDTFTLPNKRLKAIIYHSYFNYTGWLAS
jgi:hypothetical protein